MSSKHHLLKLPRMEHSIFGFSISLWRKKKRLKEFHMSTWHALARSVCLATFSLLSSLPVPLTTAHPYLFGPQVMSFRNITVKRRRQFMHLVRLSTYRYGPIQRLFINEDKLKAVRAAVSSCCLNCCSFDYDRPNCNMLKQAHSSSHSVVVLAHILLTCC